MPIAITQEQLALQASIREWASRAGHLAAVRDLEPGSAAAGRSGPHGQEHHDETERGPAGCRPAAAGRDARWDELADLGVFSIALPAEADGAGGAVADKGGGSALDAAVEELLSAVRSAGLADDPRVAEQLGAQVADGLAVSLMDLRCTLAQLQGADAGRQAAVRKLVGVAHRQAVAERMLGLPRDEAR